MNNIRNDLAGNAPTYYYSAEPDQGPSPSEGRAAPTPMQPPVAYWTPSMQAYAQLGLSPGQAVNLQNFARRDSAVVWPQPTPLAMAHLQSEPSQAPGWLYVQNEYRVSPEAQARAYTSVHPQLEGGFVPPVAGTPFEELSQSHASAVSAQVSQPPAGYDKGVVEHETFDPAPATHASSGQEEIEKNSDFQLGAAKVGALTNRRSTGISPTLEDWGSWDGAKIWLPEFPIVLRQVHKSSGQNDLHTFFLQLHADKKELLRAEAQGQVAKDSPSHKACSYDVAGKLAEKLQDDRYSKLINSRDAFGRTVAHYATILGELGALDVLIKAGANSRLMDFYGATAESGKRYAPCVKKMQAHYKKMSSKRPALVSRNSGKAPVRKSVGFAVATSPS